MNDLLHDLPRGNRQGDQSPAATFEPTEHICATNSLAFGTGKFFLGVVNAGIQKNVDPQTQRVRRYAMGGHPIGIDDDAHVITIAGSRAGKGRAVIVPNLIRYPGSVLATDPKGELASLTAWWRDKGLGQTVHVLDPFGATSSVEEYKEAVFNPMTILDRDSDTLVEDAGLISDALVIASGGDPHWDESARHFIEGVILHVATHENYDDQRHLITVRDLVMGSHGTLREEMESNTQAEGVIQDAAASFFEKADRERDSVLSTARRHLHFLTYRPIQNVLQGENSIDLTTLKTQNTTIYLCLPAMRMGTCSRWFRLFVNLTLAALEQEQTKPPLPVLLCLDEFAVLGHMKQIEDAAGQIAGLGCKLWPVLQDLGQIKSLYKDRWETFMANAGILQFFGNNDLTTLEWISNRLGQTSIRTQSQSDMTVQQQARSAQTGLSWSMQVHNLMTPEEVGRYFRREDNLLRQVVVTSAAHPMILQRAFYDKHALFQDWQAMKIQRESLAATPAVKKKKGFWGR